MPSTPLAFGLASLALLALGAAGATPPRTEGAVYGKIIELPPVIVTDSRLPLHWLYVQLPGLEILSLCSRDATAEYARQLAAMRLALGQVLPTGFQAQLSAPEGHLICDETLLPRLNRDISPDVLAEQPDLTGRALAPQFFAVHATIDPNLALDGKDARSVFSLIRKDPRSTNLAWTPDFVFSLLHRRTPPLPDWFVRGFTYLYGSMRLVPPKSGGLGGLFTQGSGRIEIAPFVWVSPGKTWALQNDPPLVSPLLPMADLFAASCFAEPGDGEGPHDAKVVSQGALFIRWALNGDNARRQAFWSFISEAAQQPPDEAMIREFFGVGFAGLQAELYHYLYIALWRSFDIVVPSPGRIRVDPRLASPWEVARVKGEWERLETSFVKATYPDLAGRYYALARSTLWQAYAAGDREPRLLATMGLLECDAGNDPAALPFLTAAVRAGVDRPQAYFELARIRYAHEIARAGGPGAKLDSDQISEVLAPLTAGSAFNPPLAEASELAAVVWLHSQHAPGTPALIALESQARLFSDPLLSYEVATLDAQFGRRSEAVELASAALARSPDDRVRNSLELLAASLRSVSVPSGRP